MPKRLDHGISKTALVVGVLWSAVVLQGRNGDKSEDRDTRSVMAWSIFITWRVHPNPNPECSTVPGLFEQQTMDQHNIDWLVFTYSVASHTWANIQILIQSFTLMAFYRAGHYFFFQLMALLESDNPTTYSPPGQHHFIRTVLIMLSRSLYV